MPIIDLKDFSFSNFKSIALNLDKADVEQWLHNSCKHNNIELSTLGAHLVKANGTFYHPDSDTCAMFGLPSEDTLCDDINTILDENADRLDPNLTIEDAIDFFIRACEYCVGTNGFDHGHVIFTDLSEMKTSFIRAF